MAYIDNYIYYRMEKLTKKERLLHYRKESKLWLNKRLRIKYIRTKDIEHCLVGIVIKVNKNSIKLMQEYIYDKKEQKLIICIGFRNILNHKIL